ncbi:hypothetical protein V6N13_038141 [Hibiscus sabdariffa]|uniref:Uncharacterized protein n=1 Tax=Hibiscus sabdariffa TaxID=183260 RepID=A0ABR2S2V4_9ROSI
MSSRFVVINGVWIQDDWRCGITSVYAPFGLTDQRLRDLKGFLKGWNANLFGNVDRHIQDVTKNIEEIDCADPTSGELQQLLVKKRELQADL